MFENFDYGNNLRATLCHPLGNLGLHVTRDLKVNRVLSYDRIRSIHRFHHSVLDCIALSCTDS